MTTRPEPGTVETLAPDVADLLAMFARACRAATRAIALYPAEHPAVGTTMAHVAAVLQKASAVGGLRLGVLPDTLTIDNRRLARPETAVTELAAVLHTHQVGQLTVLPMGTANEWRRFLSLVALPPDQMRRRGGLARLWATEGQTRIVVRQIDYAMLLRERIQGDRAKWDTIVAQCLDGNAPECDDWVVNLVLEMLDRPESVGEFLATVEGSTAPRTERGPVVVTGLLRAVAEHVARTRPDRAEPLLAAMANAAAQMPLPTLAGIAGQGHEARRPDIEQFVSALGQRISDSALADRVVQAVREGQGSSPMLSDFLLGFVPDVDRRSSVLSLARQSMVDVSGAQAADRDLQSMVERLLAHHDERGFVSDTYTNELHRLVDRAVDLEQDVTDPPARISEWVDSVSDERLRLLDAALLVDLMRLQTDMTEWGKIASLATARLGVFLTIGDLDTVASMAESFRQQRENHPTPEVREGAQQLLNAMLGPDLVAHFATALDTGDPAVIASAKRICHAIGASVVPRLTALLAKEGRLRPRQHLMAILATFGTAGQRAVEDLMQSSSAAARRTGVQLLREFGSADALSRLEPMLFDEEPHVQHEATRAIAMLATESAYRTLAEALAKGSDASRAGIASVVWSLPSAEVAPLLAHLVVHAPLGGSMRAIHERALQRLGTAGSPATVRALARALERGSLLAPMRSRALRRCAADALARIATPDAIDRLRAAAAGSSRGVKAAAAAALLSLGPQARLAERETS
jgi:HEAT repeat protein